MNVSQLLEAFLDAWRAGDGSEARERFRALSRALQQDGELHREMRSELAHIQQALQSGPAGRDLRADAGLARMVAQLERHLSASDAAAPR